MSRCTDDNCIHDHVWPNLREPKPAGDGGYYALAPCHDDATHSLSVSTDHGRILWNCFACKERLGNDMAQIRTRSAMIRDGVPAGCLPPTREQTESALDVVRDILHSDASQVDKVFRLAVLVECGGEMPAGSELDRLGEWCGVSRRAAYRVRGASTDNL